MRRAAKMGVLLLALATMAAVGETRTQAAEPDCEVISATHSAESKGEALVMSRALAAESAKELKRTRGWTSITMTAYKVKPDPFWKSVRKSVPEDIIYGSFATAKTYSTCFTGVVVPYVCTSGSRVCGK
jgi:hypothetical protein